MALDPVELLIAEDSDDDVLLLREALEMAKVLNVMHVAPDGDEAMAYLRKQGKYKHAKRPGLVLLDINMPKRNGLEVLDEIKKDPDLRSLPVVMLTVSNRDEDIVRAYAGGAATYIRKPVNFEEFQRVIRQFSLYWALVATMPGSAGNGHRGTEG